ncbi:MAG: hypothetical protein O2931_11660 [Planctomycetota bacterium]|nr:hypothetical protein [Planctomycetota bacterium]
MSDPDNISKGQIAPTTPVCPAVEPPSTPQVAGSGDGNSPKFFGTDGAAERLYRALGPLAGGIILDVTDFLTFGPIGIALGLIIGCPVGYWVSGMSKRTRVLFAVLAGVYCTIPSLWQL